MATSELIESRSTTRRIFDVDALRGFALLGILIVNIAYFASGYPSHVAEDPAYMSDLDETVRWIGRVFVDMKFYLIFSFLFGYSFTLQMDAAAAAGAEFKPRMRRRVAGLFVLGALHAVILFNGDILTTYAILGFVLLLMHKVKDRTALITAGVLFGITCLSLLTAALTTKTSDFIDPVEAQEAGRRSTEALQGGFADIIPEHLGSMGMAALNVVSLQGEMTMAMLLLGMVAGRRRLLANVTDREAVLRKTQLIGFPIGLIGSISYATIGGNGHVAAVFASALTAPFLSAAYIATLLRIMHSRHGHRIRDTLALAGRMALSNYLGQSVICVLIFTGVGFGWAGHVSPLETAVVSFAIFGAQLVFSSWWLKRHGWGPAEWLLRWFTNAARPAWH